jgi:hypothetical protein
LKRSSFSVNSNFELALFRAVRLCKLDCLEKIATTFVKPSEAAIFADSKMPAPRGKCASFPVDRELQAITAIAGLLFQRSPAAISWLVITLPVPPVERMPIARTPPHVFKEGEEISPAFADTNTNRTIALVSLILWINATIPHLNPDLVFGAVRNSEPLTSSTFFHG